MAKKVEEVDREKIKRVNDDLDTLLVFVSFYIRSAEVYQK